MGRRVDLEEGIVVGVGQNDKVGSTTPLLLGEIRVHVWCNRVENVFDPYMIYVVASLQRLVEKGSASFGALG